MFARAAAIAHRCAEHTIPHIGKASALLELRGICRGENPGELRKLAAPCVDPPLNSNRNHEIFRGETKRSAASRCFKLGKRWTAF